MVQKAATFSCWHRRDHFSFDAQLWMETVSVERMAILQKLRRVGSSSVQLAEASPPRLGINEFVTSKQALTQASADCVCRKLRIVPMAARWVPHKLDVFLQELINTVLKKIRSLSRWAFFDVHPIMGRAGSAERACSD